MCGCRPSAVGAADSSAVASRCPVPQRKRTHSEEEEEDPRGILHYHSIDDHHWVLIVQQQLQHQLRRRCRASLSLESESPDYITSVYRGLVAAESEEPALSALCDWAA